MDIENKQPTKQERRMFRREEKEKQRQQREKKRIVHRITLWLLILFSIGGVFFGGRWFLTSRPSISESEIISRRAIHWHADLRIKILGRVQDSPINVGGGHGPIHTHEADGVIHIEPTGLVTKDDVRLSRFFKVWEKKFNKDCIFDKCSGSEDQLKMFVNDRPNFEFENYLMQDGDKIEIVFE